MRCQWRVISCSRHTTLVRDVETGEGYACVGVGGIQQISVPSSLNFAENLKLLFKKKSKKKKSKPFAGSPARFYFLLEYNCFTMLCQFLLCREVNQLYVKYIPPFINLPSPPPSHLSRSSQSIELSFLCFTAGSH